MIAAKKRKLGIKGQLGRGWGGGLAEEGHCLREMMWDQLGSGEWKKGPQAARNQFADLESGLPPCLVGRRVERVPVHRRLNTATLERTHLACMDAGQALPREAVGSSTALVCLRRPLSLPILGPSLLKCRSARRFLALRVLT